ncbi:cation:dicarboxylate symporter family transporter [Pleomorphochaeta sp. DL1XJH-081]|jgi:Na+/H+-dicarboxylate symporter|uniref:cation:dicarboxylate symporter family transporter n=1 Tax=Pleomorphochaeta sp. DL1XJH-081 TaxID=3409690 RepID=UPI003BB597EC
MKTWITYPAAIIFGLAATLLLKDWQPYTDFLNAIVPFAHQLGLFVLFPIVFTLFTAATASLRRYKDTIIVFSSAFFWGLITALLLSFLGMGLAIASPFVLDLPPSTSQPEVNFFQFSTLSNFFITTNAFNQFTVTSISLLPILIVAMVFGISLRPDREAIRPAYVVVNSFAEAMMRLARIFSVIGAALLLVISAKWFIDFPGLLVSKENILFSVALLATVVIAIFLLLPLLFGVATLFKGGNPYKILFGTMGALLASGFSGSLLFGTTPLIALTQHNCGVRKRVSGISIPLLTILGRGGSAMVASFTIITLIESMGNPLSLQSMVAIALFSALFSFGASFSPGLEVIFIMVFVMGGIQGEGTSILSSGIVVLLPCLQMAALITDSAINAFGTTFGSRIVSPDDRVPIEEMM